MCENSHAEFISASKTAKFVQDADSETSLPAGKAGSE